MPKDPRNQINVAIENAYQAMKFQRTDEVREIYKRLTIDSSNDPTFANIFAQIALQNNLITEGIIWLRKSLEINPDQEDILLNLGVALSEIDEFSDALDYFDKVIKLNANIPLAHFNQGLVYRYLNQLDNALNSYKNALKISPNYLDALNGIGRIYHIKKEYYQAIEYYDKAIKSQYNYAGSFYNKAMVLDDLKEYLLAVDSYYQALKYKPDFFEAYNNLGNTLHKLKRYDEALSAYDHAIQLKPDDPTLHWNKSLVKLILGNYEEGWKLYEWRRQTKKNKNNYKVYDQPLWLGQESIRNKTILVESEQGFGDVIQFCRYIPLLENLGAKVIVEAPKELISILRSLNGNFLIVEKGQSLNHFDFHIPIMSLPHAFKTNINNIPASIPYLFSSKTKREYWNKKIGKKKPLIGLVWSGSITHKNDKNRSLLLNDLEPILQMPFEFHSLQKEIRENDQQTLFEFKQIHQHQNELKDFSDTAALIEEMDLVISVDTSVAHLAGALGKDVWILLPYHPDFRWMLDRKDSPWYPTCSLFRKSEINDWEKTIEEITSNLQDKFNLKS